MEILLVFILMYASGLIGLHQFYKKNLKGWNLFFICVLWPLFAPVIAVADDISDKIIEEIKNDTTNKNT